MAYLKTTSVEQTVYSVKIVLLKDSKLERILLYLHPVARYLHLHSLLFVESFLSWNTVR
jgi:hypothetical protein